MMNTTEDVEALAARLHAGQVDKVGVPYIEHLRAVATILLRRWPDAPAHAIEAAWLHDALEDTSATPESLADEGVSAEAIAIVSELTKPDGAVYLEWIQAIADTGSHWAIRVKLADNEHNSDLRRGHTNSLAEKRYAPARAILESADSRTTAP